MGAWLSPVASGTFLPFGPTSPAAEPLTAYPDPFAAASRLAPGVATTTTSGRATVTTEGGGYVTTEGGGYVLTEAASTSETTTTTVGHVTTEGGGHVLTEGGGYVLTEAGSTSTEAVVTSTRPAGTSTTTTRGGVADPFAATSRLLGS